MATKIGVISLGCAKNRVDTEVMLGMLAESGYEFVQEIEQADIALINTCAFIDDAKEESINVILEAEQQKKFGKLQAIIVTGCLPQRFKEELSDILPRVDAFLGIAAYKEIVQVVEDVIAGKKVVSFADRTLEQNFEKRILTTVKPTAFVKIAEGCDNCCSYCVIPQIRGPYQSRSKQSILEEIQWLASEGYSEIILIAQDTTNYGADIYGKPSLAELMDQAAQIKGVKWLRVLYSYPDAISDDLLDVMVQHENIVKYLDIPVQHLDDTILKAMNRRTTYAQIKEVVRKVRAASPHFVIRSTIIVGYPGESRENTSLLRQRLKELSLDHVGVFTYSREENTPAAKLGDAMDASEAEFHRDTVLNTQAPISLAKNRQRIGAVYDVLIEGQDDYSGRPYGRSYAQIPDVDGKIFIDAEKELLVGQYYPVRITDAYNYDSVGSVVLEERDK